MRREMTVKLNSANLIKSLQENFCIFRKHEGFSGCEVLLTTELHLKYQILVLNSISSEISICGEIQNLHVAETNHKQKA